MPQEKTPDIMMMAIDELYIGKSNVRWGVENLSDLVDSIRQVGILEPLIVRPMKDMFEVVAGSRRLAAARELGISQVPCIVRNLEDEEAVLVSVTENVQRGDLREEEIIRAFHSLREKDPKQWNANRFAERIGKSAAWMKGLLLAHEALTKIRATGMDVTMKFRPSVDERERGAISVSHLQETEKAIRAIQKNLGLTDKETTKMRVELVKAIQDLPREDARRLIDKFRADPFGSLEDKRSDIQTYRSGVVFRRTYLPANIVREIDAIAQFSNKSTEEMIPVLVETALRNTGGSSQTVLVERSAQHQSAKVYSLAEQYHQQRMWNFSQLKSMWTSLLNGTTNKQRIVYTTGYSQKTISQLIELLQKVEATLLVDVRRNPLSQYRPDFNARRLKEILSQSDIEYVHLPDFGVPRSVRSRLFAGEMSYEAFFAWYDKNVLKESLLDELEQFIGDKTVCLMCTEVSPTICHRHRIAVRLTGRGWNTLDL